MFTPINNSRAAIESGLPSGKSLQDSAIYNIAAAHPSVGPAARSETPRRMLGLICDTVELRHEPIDLSLRLANNAASAPERNVWVLWNRMLKDFELSPALDDPRLIGLDAVPAIRKWYVSHATFIQDLMSRCPRLRRMAIALKWLEDTFETPKIADTVVPYTPGTKNNSNVDPDLQRKIFLQLRAGRWEKASNMADEGSAFVSHMINAAQMVAPNSNSNTNTIDSRWQNKMPRAPLFGEYEVQASGNPRVRPVRNPHRLPLLLRMYEHLREGVQKPQDAAADQENNYNSHNDQQEFFFDGIAGVICGDESAMKDACRAHFGATPAAAQRNARNNSSKTNMTSVNNISSWQDELWCLIRSSLIAAFTTCIIRGASDAPNSSLVEQFDGVFSKQAIERFVSSMESRCGLSGGQDTVSADDANFSDWFATMESSICNMVVARLRGLSTNFESDSVDGIALQSLLLFLSDMSRGGPSSHTLSGIISKVAPVRDVDASGAPLSNYLRWCLPEQASLCCLASLVATKRLMPDSISPQSSSVYADVISSMISSCLTDPNLEVTDFIQTLETIAMYSALTEDPTRRVITHTAVLRCVRIRFVGDKGNYISPETTSAEGFMSQLLRQADEQLYNGNSSAVDSALKIVASKLRDDPVVPMLTHDTRCESVLWKSFLSPSHRTKVIAEAVTALKDLWNENRNLRAMQDIVDIWQRRLENWANEIDNNNNSNQDDTTAMQQQRTNSGVHNNNDDDFQQQQQQQQPASPTAKRLVREARDQVQFWASVLKCYDIATKIEEYTSQLVAAGNSSTRNNNNMSSMMMTQSKRHDLCVSALSHVDELSTEFNTVTSKCPKYGATAVCAALELLVEATRTLLPFVSSQNMARIFQQTFQKLPQVDSQCRFFGVVSAVDDAMSEGVELLPQNSAAMLMRSLQALRVVYVAQLQKRKAEEMLAASRQQ